MGMCEPSSEKFELSFAHDSDSESDHSSHEISVPLQVLMSARNCSASMKRLTYVMRATRMPQMQQQQPLVDDKKPKDYDYGRVASEESIISSICPKSICTEEFN